MFVVIIVIVIPTRSSVALGFFRRRQMVIRSLGGADRLVVIVVPRLRCVGKIWDQHRQRRRYEEQGDDTRRCH